MSDRTLKYCIQTDTETTWIVCDELRLFRVEKPTTTSWSDGNGRFFDICQLSTPTLSSQPVSAQSDFELVHNVAEQSAVWRIGEAYCKVKAKARAGCTPEHVTMDFVCKKNPRTFKTPTALYHQELPEWYIIIVSRLEGDTIAEAWWSMGEKEKDDCIKQMVRVCQEMTTWQSKQGICGVDGLNLSDEFLAFKSDMTSETLIRTCKELKMDCSVFSFYHCDLSPANVIIGPDGSIGIIDWETAGYVPREWYRTKVRVCMGLNFVDRDGDMATEWRRMFQKQLGSEGFGEVAHEWAEWFENKRAKSAS
ncbi:hypothetical protein Micbo1qcDRAFT_225558 [Microdochium bolleyi]|uniref:Aminoglycoside phosphotransferase domain-containing protein n=1 Tax=Microdochium bolleyi TaxID=196109 RepID=A0A136IJ10_9PEZI|nr:hypothetical protein Micbo1qcDRAFT_225558 [Microdochium bolleyi]